jgi:general secretion pathway protein D
MQKICMALLVVLSFHVGLRAQEATVSMDFQGVEMPVFLQWFADLTHKKIIYSEGRQATAQRKIYLIAPQPVPQKAVEKIAMSLLESNGLTLVKAGKNGSEVYKLVETSQASTKPVGLYTQKELEKLGEGDYYVSQLVLIKYLKVEVIAASLRQAKLLDPQAGSLVEIRGANALIVSDFLPNVQRIQKIIAMLDKEPPKMEMTCIALKHARSDEVSQKLQQMFQNRARELAEYYTSASGQPTIMSDSRTNSLTLRGTPEDIRELKTILEQLDREVKENEVVAKVYRLRHITAEKVLPTLREFIATPLFRDKSLLPGQATSSSLQNISILANDHARRLIITAPLSAHKLVEEIIQELDVRRPQVLLEAVICEFTPTDVLNLGIELMRLDDVNEDNGVFSHGISSFGLSSIVDSSGNPISSQKPATPTGRALAPGSGFVGFLTKDKSTNIPILIRALQSVTKADVISVPRILVDDGERAEIRVQQEEPTTSINALNPTSTTVSFKEFVSAGTVLIIKPQLIEDNWLRLEIEQNIEAFVGSSPAAGIPPPKSSRSLKTIVTVPNGHTVILGGLCGRREVETVDKIPLLGDIPLLGLLFRSSSHTVSKTNLYIFIQPKILLHPEFEDLQKISEDEMEKVKDLKDKLKESDTYR